MFFMPIDTLLISASDSIAFTQIIEVECKDDDLRANSLADPLCDVRKRKLLKARRGPDYIWPSSPAHNLSNDLQRLFSRVGHENYDLAALVLVASGIRLSLESISIMNPIRKPGSLIWPTQVPILVDDTYFKMYDMFRTLVAVKLEALIST